MNIWCISKYASPAKYSKMPARLFYLCQEWLKLGHNVSLFTSDANHLAQFPETQSVYNQETIDGVPVCWIKTKKFTKTASIARVLSWFDFERRLFCLDRKKLDKPDVVIVSSLSIFSIVYGYFLKKKYKAFLVFEIRDIWPLTMTEEGGFSKWHPLVLFTGWIEKFGYKVADLVVGTMPKLDDHVKNILGYERPFHCAPLGFHPNNYQKENLQENNPFHDVFPKNKIIIGYAGSMGITNALEPFIQTIKDLKEEANVHFMLVGSGGLRAQFEQELKDCKNVTFLPRIAQNEVKYFLAKCDVLYLSTHHSTVWDYGQSMNKVVEYMLAAKPIIASYAGYPSMINEAECGFFVKPEKGETIENSIQRVLLSVCRMTVEERASMGKKGKDWIFAHRSYADIAQQYIDKIRAT